MSEEERKITGSEEQTEETKKERERKIQKIYAESRVAAAGL